MVHITELLVNSREYDAIRNAIHDSITDDPRFPSLSPVQSRSKQPPITENPNLAAFRAATRVYLGTRGGLKLLQTILAVLASRRKGAKPRKNLIADPHRFALSMSALLFFHRILYRLISVIRLKLLHEKVKAIRERWPRLYDLLTWKLMPAIGASLSGLALGICPKDQLRVTIAVYVLVRAVELLMQGAEIAGYVKRPKWIGSWILFALTQGQLLHTFVFDPDCFPDAYAEMIIANTPEYAQRRPAGLSEKVDWPTSRQIVSGLADMARLRWPAYVSPILRPKDLTTLPAGVSPAVWPITSRAHPALQHLSCALLHPSETSCFAPFLRQVLLSFNSLGRFFIVYYTAFSLLGFRTLRKAPAQFFSSLVVRILKVTTVMCLAIAGSWGSICFFNNYLPKSVFPTFRFFLGGAISGCVAIIDRSATAHENNMYAVRNSLPSLWKVGVKRRWWRSVKGGDVGIFVIALAVLNILYDIQKDTAVGKARTMMAIKLLRGDIEVGLKSKEDEKKEIK